MEPLDLLLAHRVLELDLFLATLRVVDDRLHRLAGRQVLQARHADRVALQDPIVVVGVGECQRQQALLLQVRLVDAGEAARDDGAVAGVSGFSDEVDIPARFARRNISY